jgi:hypothetical protein
MNSILSGLSLTFLAFLIFDDFTHPDTVIWVLAFVNPHSEPHVPLWPTGNIEGYFWVFVDVNP